MIDKVKTKVIGKGERENLYKLIAPQICHMAWVAYQMGAGQKYNVNPTQEQLRSHLDAVKFFLKNPNATPKQNHNNWVQFKLTNGWKYGKKKDVVKKTHPDIMLYEKLPKVEKMKDTMDIETRRFVVRLINEISRFYYDEIKNYLRAFEDD